MNSGIPRRVDRRSFIGGAGALTLAACSGGAALSGLPARTDSLKPGIACAPGDCAPSGGGLPANLSGLTTAAVAAITAAEIAALSGDQIASFTDTQLHYITQAQAFHGAQAAAVLQRLAHSQATAPPLYQAPGAPPPPTPQPYTPPTPGSNFMAVMGGIIGGAVGTAVGSLGGPFGSFLGGTAGSALLGYFAGLGSDASYQFFNSDTGYWDSVDLGDCCAESSENGNTGQSSLDTDGYTVIGSYSSSCDDAKHRFDNANCTGTVTVTVIAN